MKTYLMTPGPTPVPPEVAGEEAKPIIHHRTKEFKALFNEVIDGIKYVFQTKNDVIMLTSSGTGAMEACVSNLLSPGDKTLVLNIGVFAERWGKILKAYGLEPVEIKEEWGNAIDLKKVEEALKKEPKIKAVFTQLTETSTGVVNDIKAIAKIVKKTDAVLVVDAISGLGAQEFRMDDWDVDVAVTGSQKGLMIPPGLAAVALNDKAWKMVEQSKLPKFYFTLKAGRESLKKGQTPYTPAVSLFVALRKSLEMIKKEGLENVYGRHQKLARATRAAVKALGLELFAKSPCDAVTSVKVPEGVDGEALKEKMRLEYGIAIAGGQKDLKGKIFRIGHLGYMEMFDTISAIAGLEIVLKELGYNVELGKGVAAAQEEIAKK
ncbi:MAG: alanine--glyoxylate aminotransferase family protein [bacterium]